jgi:hypothetical protein
VAATVVGVAVDEALEEQADRRRLTATKRPAAPLRALDDRDRITCSAYGAGWSGR